MVDILIMRVAGSQYGLFSRDQWFAVGGDDKQLSWRLSTGALTSEGPGVYGIPGWPECWMRDLWRGHLVIGPHSAASFEAAASVHQLWPFPKAGRIELSVLHGDHARPDGVTVHQPRDLRPEHIVVVDGLRVTSIARTLCDLAERRRRQRLATGIEKAHTDGKCKVGELVALYEELKGPGKRGFKMLGQILEVRREDFEIPPSYLEKLFRKLLRKHGLTEPVWQPPLPWDPRRRADGLWIPQRALLELDSRSWHGRMDQMSADRKRDREARRNGYDLHRFTYEEVKYESKMVVAELRDLLV